MGRMHSAGKGISQSALPYRRSVPTWLKLSKDDVEDQIVKLAKKGLTPSQIAKGLAPSIPEDLHHLIKKAVSIRKHLERNRKDRDSKFRLILVEARIHRLGRYFKSRGVLDPKWKYESATASALVS
ncbi:40S ribosomal protein S13 [Armadillidium nasatum]|uniref:Small ribosomal subunit protein uS15 n=1 Tax=Armadillidium nasatum TaxID=96803 RepID=A0A5N5TMQ7_9CRUS|nr:40S ribosomal protein S13 [Armadillidium nasatum]